MAPPRAFPLLNRSGPDQPPCETQLIEAMDDWTTVMNKGSSQIDIIVLDFSKAFDMVPHQRLIQKLNSYGITGRTQLWIASFLSSRTQEVVVRGTSSEVQEASHLRSSPRHSAGTPSFPPLHQWYWEEFGKYYSLVCWWQRTIQRNWDNRRLLLSSTWFI